ncbi:MAG: YciI family protein [Janthinobacterium lividum]
MVNISMICIRIAHNAPDRAVDRAGLLAAHKTFLRSGCLTVLQSGPIFDQEGNQVGAIVVADTPDIGTMEAICAEDPFVIHGIYHRISFLEWRITVERYPQCTS